MKYIGYSELTKRYYLLPRSKKESKVDITDDIKEIISFHGKDLEEKHRLLSESNSIIRSFNSVIERTGADTNWEAIGKQVTRILKEQRDAGIR